jgi:hypothetical protein
MERPWYILGTTLEFSWEDWGKSQQISVMITGSKSEPLDTEVGTFNPDVWSHELYVYVHNVLVQKYLWTAGHSFQVDYCQTQKE